MDAPGNAVEAAVLSLYAALDEVAGLRLVRGLGKSLHPPAVVVDLPQLTWAGPGSDPTDATFVVAVVVAVNDREVPELIRWGLAVVTALDEVDDAVVRSAAPGAWRVGAADLPAYLIQVEYAL